MNRDSGGAPTETLGYPVCTVEERFNLRGRRYYEYRVVGGMKYLFELVYVTHVTLSAKLIKCTKKQTGITLGIGQVSPTPPPRCLRRCDDP